MLRSIDAMSILFTVKRKCAYDLRSLIPEVGHITWHNHGQRAKWFFFYTTIVNLVVGEKRSWLLMFSADAWESLPKFLFFKRYYK